MDIPTWKCEEISMEFITRLPITVLRYDLIWVVVDLLTKVEICTHQEHEYVGDLM